MMQEISCILCGKWNTEIVIRENGFAGCKCSKCNLIYISPRPTRDEITNLYKDEHAVIDADAQFPLDKYKRMIAVETLKKIHKYKKDGELLEIGAGGGHFLEEARKKGYIPHGIELNPIEAKWIKVSLSIECEREELNENSFSNKKFDIIYHNDVLSHLYNPIETYDIINNKLKDDGILVFETGNIGEVKSKYFKYFAQFSYPDHLFFFSQKSIELLLEKTGFKCKKIERRPLLLNLILQKILWVFKDKLKNKSQLEKMKTDGAIQYNKNSELDIKKNLRIWYRYLSYYLTKFAIILPKHERPHKLLVFAKKIRAD